MGISNDESETFRYVFGKTGNFSGIRQLAGKVVFPEHSPLSAAGKEPFRAASYTLFEHRE